MDLCKLGASELARQIREGSISAVEATQAYLQRISRFDKVLHCFICLDDEGVLASARAVDKRLAAGDPVGPLAGVPLALKDNLVTRGLQTTCGSAMLKGWIPPYDGTAVSLLKQAGAVILGKLNMDEFAMGSSTENSAFGPCRNPWDTSRVPGGSSGGAAAAVAADLCAAALGSDTGGSIRQPASLCGVVGLKPTYGRVSRYGLVAFASSLDQIGPLTKTVQDSALLLEVIAGHDRRDSTSIPSDAPAEFSSACSRQVRGLRLGVPGEFFGPGLDQQVEQQVRLAIRTLEELGAEIVEINLPHTPHAVAAYYLIATAEASSNLARFDGVRYGKRAASSDLAQMYEQTRQGFGPEVKRRIMLGTFALSAGYYDAYYAKAQRTRTLIQQDFATAFERCDLIATPTSPVTAFKLGERMEDPLQMYLADIYTLSCNLAGLPGLSVPCGLTDEGLPVGLQLLAPPLDEATLFGAAASLMTSSGHALPRPRLDQGDADA